MFTTSGPRRAKMNVVRTDTKVIGIPYHRLDEATDLLARAFESDPVIAIFVPHDRTDRLRVLRELFRYSCMARLTRTQPVIGLEYDNRIVGVSLLLTPYSPAGTNLLERQWERTKQAIGEESVRLLEEFVAAREEFLPPRSHHVLTVMGVDPKYQKMGFGRESIEATLEIARGDMVSCGVVLDTTGKKNVAFYELNGFKVVGSKEFHGVPVVYMYYAIR